MYSTKICVTKGDLCKATKGRLLSTYLSILLCLHRRYSEDTQFLTEIEINGSTLFTLSDSLGVDIIDIITKNISKNEDYYGLSNSIKKEVIKESFLDNSIHKYEDSIISDIKKSEQEIVDIDSLRSIKDIKLYVNCFDRKYASNLDSVFDTALMKYGFDMNSIVNDIKKAVEYI